jgi:hypothetical protein
MFRQTIQKIDDDIVLPSWNDLNAVCSSSTKSRIFDYLVEHRPRYFIIDEIWKMNKTDQACLLSFMESGLLSELKHRQQRTTQLKTWVC